MYSHRSIMWLRQMAQLSTTMSQAHKATAFHYQYGQGQWRSEDDHMEIVLISYLLDLEPLLPSTDGVSIGSRASLLRLDEWCSRWGIGHVNISHDDGKKSFPLYCGVEVQSGN
jgi:hypothetical protein